MIASPALPPMAALPILGGIQPGEPAEAVQGADFLSILAISAQQALPAGDAPIDPAAFAAPTQPPSAAASTAATTGKILPLTLPDAPLPDSALPAEAEVLPVVSPPPALLHRAALPRGLAKKVELVGPLPTDEPALPAADDADQSDAASPPTPVIALLALPEPALTALTTQVPRQPGHSEHAAVLRALPALPEPRPEIAADPLSVPPTALAATASLVPRRHTAAPLTTNAALPLETAASPVAAQTEAPPAPAPLHQVRVEVALTETLPRAARAEAVKLIRLAVAQSGEKGDAAASVMLPLTAQPVAPLAPLATAPAAPPARPQDFAALIDRLSAAREAAAPQSVTVSLPHAEFGRVQLHFRHEDGALAVSLASADPDFARIAAQAAPQVIALPEQRSADAAGNQPASARSDGQSAQSAAGGQQRGNGHERRSDGQHQAASQPRARASAERQAGRSGIFA